jgi:hypothetical protein
MEHENLKRQAAELGLRGGDLAALANMAGSKLSNFFRGRITLDAAKRNELMEVIADLKKLKACFPILIGTHDAKQVAVMLERFRTGKFEKFLELTKSIQWDEPEGLNRKFPKLFKSNTKSPTGGKEKI